MGGVDKKTWEVLTEKTCKVFMLLCVDAPKCVCVYLSRARVFSCLHLYLSICMCVYVSMCLCGYVCMCIRLYLSTRLFVDPSMCLCDYMSL